MIYLVSENRQLFQSEHYEMISIEKSLEIIQSWDIVQFDTETSGRDPHVCKVLCAQFGNREAGIQIVVDTTTTNLLLYKDILETKLIVGHNLKFDIQFLYQYEIIPRKVWDTMIIEQLLHLGFDNRVFHYSLQAVADRRLKIDIDKTTRGEIIWRGLDNSVIKYAAGDVMYLEDIRDSQLIDLKKKDCEKAAELENRFVPVIAYLEWCGIMLDTQKWIEKMESDKMYYLFFDEIQVVPEFERVINSLRMKYNASIFITGSNANLLSGELATLLAGRYVTFKIMPFTFAECLQIQNITNPTDSDLMNYLKFGGMPQRFYLSTESEIKIFLSDLYDSILLKDISSLFSPILKLFKVFIQFSKSTISVNSVL